MNLAKAIKEAEAEDAIKRETNRDEFEKAFINNDLLGRKMHPSFVDGS